MSDPETPEPPPVCAFCDKRADQVRVLVAGHTAHICDECIALAQVAVGPPPAAAVGDAARDHLYMAWADFVVARRWTLAMMTGVLMQLADEGGTGAADGGANGFQMIALALNQVHRPPPPRDADDILRCDYCARRGDELRSLSAGHGGTICGDCLESLTEIRAMGDPAYRAELIERLGALTDAPWPPDLPPLG